MEDTEQRLRRINEAIATATRGEYAPLRATTALLDLAIGSTPVQAVLGALEPDGFSVNGEVLLVGDSLVARMVGTGLASPRHHPSEEGDVRVTTFPRASLRAVHVHTPKRPFNRMWPDEIGLTHASELELCYRALPNPMTFSLANFNTEEQRELIALFLADLRA